MELFTAYFDGFFTQGNMLLLLQIIIIDLVLAGDNALVIAMAARNIAPHLQHTVILIGTLGAIILRVLATIVAVYLLKIPLLMAIGGLALIYIGYKLMINKKHNKDIAPKNTFFSALFIVILADFVMSLDNVLAIAGISEGNITLIVIGIALSLVMIVAFSKILLVLMEKYPFIVIIGAAVIIITGVKMIFRDNYLSQYIGLSNITMYIIAIVVAVIVILLTKMLNNKKA